MVLWCTCLCLRLLFLYVLHSFLTRCVPHLYTSVPYIVLLEILWQFRITSHDILSIVSCWKTVDRTADSQQVWSVTTGSLMIWPFCVSHHTASAYVLNAGQLCRPVLDVPSDLSKWRADCGRKFGLSVVISLLNKHHVYRRNRNRQETFMNLCQVDHFAVFEKKNYTQEYLNYLFFFRLLEFEQNNLKNSCCSLTLGCYEQHDSACRRNISPGLLHATGLRKPLMQLLDKKNTIKMFNRRPA